MRQPMIDELKALLTGDITVYGHLLALAQEKKDVLKDNNIQRLGELTKLEGEALLTGKQGNAKKDALVKAIEQEEGLTDPDMSQIIALIPDPRVKAELDELRNKLSRIVQELSNVNGVNQRLLETHLQYTSFCMNLITAGEVDGGFYGSSGAYRDEPAALRRNLIDRKA